MIYQLMYFSIARDGLTESDVDDIVRTALHKNPVFDVTGFLTFNGVEFLQFMEGREENVRQLMANIDADDRHHSVLTIETARAAQRAFPDWSMRRLNDAPARGTDMDAVAPEIRSTLNAMMPEFRYAYANYLNNA